KLTLGHPEILLEALLQRTGFLLQLGGPLLVAFRAEDLRHQLPTCVQVPLHLAQSDWRLSQFSVGVKNRIAGILPTLIRQCFLADAAISQIAVAASHFGIKIL